MLMVAHDIVMMTYGLFRESVINSFGPQEAPIRPCLMDLMGERGPRVNRPWTVASAAPSRIDTYKMADRAGIFRLGYGAGAPAARVG